MIDPTLTNAAAILLAAYAVLAAIDGLYIHLWRLRLHQRAETRCEHWLHTLRALLFPARVGGLFAAPTAGALLWAAVGVAALDLVIGLWDVAISRQRGTSRRRCGSWCGRRRRSWRARRSAQAAARRSPRPP